MGVLRELMAGQAVKQLLTLPMPPSHLNLIQGDHFQPPSLGQKFMQTGEERSSFLTCKSLSTIPLPQRPLYQALSLAAARPHNIAEQVRALPYLLALLTAQTTILPSMLFNIAIMAGLGRLIQK